MKRFNALTSITVAISSLLMPIASHAATFFSENFESAPYDLAPGFHSLPTGTGQINYGYWEDISSGNGKVGTTNAASFGGSHSLILDFSAGGGGASQVIGYFGTDNSAGSLIISAFTFSLSFQVSDKDNYTNMSFRNSAGDFLAEIYLGLDNYFTVTEGGDRKYLAPVSTNTWYTATFNLPGAGDDPFFTVSLYDQSGEFIASGRYAFYNAVGDGYKFFTLGTPSGTVTYIDNIVAQTIPESSAFIFGAIGGFLLLGCRRMGGWEERTRRLQRKNPGRTR